MGDGSDEERERRRLARAVAVNLAAALLFAWGAIIGLSWLLADRGPLDMVDTATKLSDVVKLAFGATAGIGGVVGLTVAYRRQKHLEEDSAGKRDQIRLLTERFGAAATQLGAAEPATRLAGVYAMAGIADEWIDQQQQCIDVLCAYLRLPYTPQTGQVVPATIVLEHGWLVGGGSGRETKTWTHRSGEREVRLTIISVIREHLVEGAQHRWHGRNFNFSGAAFDGGDFKDAIFSGGFVDFSEATFSREFDFTRAHFSGAAVNFMDAAFFGHNLYFTGAEFSRGEVNFHNVRFPEGRVWFTSAVFAGATITFDYASFGGADLWFGRSRFSGSTVTFTRSTFSAGALFFEDVIFSGGLVRFDEATFVGGLVQFNAAQFVGGAVTKDGEDFRGYPAPAAPSTSSSQAAASPGPTG